jgi:glutamate synthase domain-containing protein 3
VYDPHDDFSARCNASTVALERVISTAEQLAGSDPATWHGGECDEITLKSLVERHFRYTGSEKARAILDDWNRQRGLFVKVFPHEYRRALGQARVAGTERVRATAA